MSYHVPQGGLPPQSALITDRAVFTDAYAVLPARTMADSVASHFPHWDKARFWVLARPLSGFAETFSQYLAEVAPGGGSELPDLDDTAESALFVVGGELELRIDDDIHALTAGSFAFLAPGQKWTLYNTTDAVASFHWIRKQYEVVPGVEVPSSYVAHADDIAPDPVPDTNGTWATQRFIDPDDIRYDMHINVVTFQPGAAIPFPETHVMEHGLFVLGGRGIYLLNKDWVEVEAGDFMWLRAYCPQACYAVGSEPFTYLLYKDVNRHAKLGI